MKIINKENYLPFAILSTLVWSALILFTIYIKEYNIDENVLMFWLSAFNMVFMGLLSLKEKTLILEKLKTINIKPYIYLTIFGAFSFLIYRYIFYYSIQNLNAIIVSALNYSWVLFSVIISIYIGSYKQKFDFYTKYILFFGFIGVLSIFDIFSSTTNLTLGYILVFVSALFAAIDLNIISTIKEKYINNIWFIYFNIFTIVFILMSIYVFTFNIDVSITILQFCFLFIFSLMFILASSLYMTSFSVGDKVVVGYVGYLIPIFSTTGMIIFGDYEITSSIIIGFTIVLLSGILLNKEIKRKIIMKIKYKWLLKIK